MRARFALRYGVIPAAPLTAVAGSAMAATAPASVAGCGECHGDLGVSRHPEVPSIAGMSDFYVEGQMQAYQKGQRPCPKSAVFKPPADMCEVANKLNQAQIKEIGAYYAAQKWASIPQQGLDAAKVARGRSIKAADCENCHTKGGSVPDDDAGILAGQWLPYLQSTLQDYKAGKRLAPTMMKPKMDKLSPDDLDALAQFYASEGAASN